MKFAIVIVLLVAVVSVHSQSKIAAPADNASNVTAVTPRILTPQEIIRIASALNDIVGPEHAKHLTRLAVSSLARGGVSGKADSGARSRAQSQAQSHAGSEAGSRAGADCRCLYRPIFTIL